MIPTCKAAVNGFEALKGNYVHNKEALKREEERWEEDED